MAIVIKTKKYVDKDGRKMYKVIDVQALQMRNLPRGYLEGSPCVYATDCGKALVLREKGETKNSRIEHWISVENSYTEDDMKYMLKRIRVAGERLHQINERIRKLRRSFRGKKTFTI